MIYLFFRKDHPNFGLNQIQVPDTTATSCRYTLMLLLMLTLNYSITSQLEVFFIFFFLGNSKAFVSWQSGKLARRVAGGGVYN